MAWEGEEQAISSRPGSIKPGGDVTAPVNKILSILQPTHGGKSKDRTETKSEFAYRALMEIAEPLKKMLMTTPSSEQRDVLVESYDSFQILKKYINQESKDSDEAHHILEETAKRLDILRQYVLDNFEIDSIFDRLPIVEAPIRVQKPDQPPAPPETVSDPMRPGDPETDRSDPATDRSQAPETDRSDPLSPDRYQHSESPDPFVEAPPHYTPARPVKYRHSYLSTLSLEKRKLLEKMFDTRTGFGNPKRYKHPFDDGFTDIYYVKKYLRTFVGKLPERQDLQGLWVAFKPTFDRFYVLLSTAAQTPQLAIQKLLHGEAPATPRPLPPQLDTETPFFSRHARPFLPDLQEQNRQILTLTSKYKTQLDQLVLRRYGNVSMKEAVRRALGHGDFEFLDLWKRHRSIQHLPADPKSFVSPNEMLPRHSLKVERSKHREPFANYNIDLIDPIVHDVSRRSQDSQHFMVQLDADSNMGITTAWKRQEQDPFQAETELQGPRLVRSRIMNRSAHVSYRRRKSTLEITISSEPSSFELDTLFARLGAHLNSTYDTIVFLLVGKKKTNLGALDRLNFEALRTRLESLTGRHRQVGVLLVDQKQKGLLHKREGYSFDMTEAARNGKLLVA